MKLDLGIVRKGEATVLLRFTRIEPKRLMYSITIFCLHFINVLDVVSKLAPVELSSLQVCLLVLRGGCSRNVTGKQAITKREETLGVLGGNQRFG